MRRLLPAVAGIALAALGAAAPAQDYERERRWAAEVQGNLVVGNAVRIGAPAGAFLALDAAGAPGKPAVLLVHGTGVHPDHGVMGVLRVALADMGYRTLSIQMPVLAAGAPANDYHPALFPEAAARIQAAADWLAARGERRIVLLSHSLGSWMSEAYLEGAQAPPFAAWVSLGRAGPFAWTKPPRLPVLDVYGEADLPAVREAAAARRRALEASPRSRQQVIAGADHFYNGREDALAAAVRSFVESLF